MKQRSTQQAPRLQFTRDEQSDPVMKKPIRRAQRAADARDAAQAKLPTRKRLTVQDAPEGATTPLYKRVHLTDEVKTLARSHHAITDSASTIVHERIREDEDENTAVQAVHEAEKASEAGIRAVEQVHHSAQVRAHKKAARAEKRLDCANVSALIAREQRSNPQAFSNPLSRWQQKRRIKKAYAAAKAGDQLQTARTAGAYIVSAGRKAVTFVRKGISLFPFLLLAAMLLFVLTTVSACAPLAQTVMQAVVMTTYPAEEADVLAAEQAYVAMEEALAYELDHYGELHPEYQEVIVEADEIWHDPYALISIVSAYHNGEPWTIDDVYHTLETFFHLQYVVTESVESETRYTTEIVTEWQELYNSATGRMEWTLVETEVQVPYTHSICTVTMENKNLSYLPIYYLTEEQVSLYAMYMSTLGNMPELFAGNPHASQLEEPMLYEIPEDVLAADARFAQLMEEAQKYIGYPYVWGGYNPNTSFDCSGFVCWVYTNSGVYNTGRLGATGLHGACTEVSADMARPGDLVFFEGTMGAGVDGITHVGIYVGSNIMIHCGNPISFADLTGTYWQQHFHSFGRLLH